MAGAEINLVSTLGLDSQCGIEVYLIAQCKFIVRLELASLELLLLQSLEILASKLVNSIDEREILGLGSNNIVRPKLRLHES